MTLPSSRRPRVVEELMAAQLAEEKARQEKIAFETSKNNIFRKSMADWYVGLSRKEKGVLTPKMLKRRAVHVCYINGIVYDQLPLDWVDELRTKHGLKLYQRIRKTRDFVEKQKNHSSSIQKRSSRTRTSISFDAERIDDSTSTSSPGPSTDKASKESGPTSFVPRQKKRLLDLSNEAPPPFWLKKYAEGIVLPRVLSIYSTEDSNIIYYDYNPKLKDDFGQEVKLTPQPRINTDVLTNLLSIKTNDKRRKK